MGHLTQRINQFRGINRSLQPNGLDASYAYDAVNVDIVGGRLTNKIGNYRLAMTTDVPAANPIVYFTNDQDYIILRDKYIALGRGLSARDPDALQSEIGPYEPVASHVLENVVNNSGRLIRGIGRSYVRAQIDFTEQPDMESAVDKNCIVVSGMLGAKITPGATNDYWTYRGFLVDGARAKTAMYFLGDVPGGEHPVIICKEFGSGLSLAKNIEIAEVGEDQDGNLTYIKVGNWYNNGEPPMKQFRRAVLDGIYLFNTRLDDDLTEKDLDSAYRWLKVTNVEETLSDSGDTITFTLAENQSSDGIETGDFVFIRGECSDYTVTFMQMYYGRLFAAAHRSNRDFPRRLFWSRLPGDGRTIEDWTSDDVSTETGGGFVDVGDPSDGFITGLVVCGSQLLIFTQTRLWRLYGSTPSTYKVELVGNLEGSRISNPVEVNGAVYWLSLAGISYYNGSYIVSADDNYNTRHIIENLPREMQDAMYYSTVHAELFDGSIVFAFDPAKESVVTIPRVYPQTSTILRYELQTGNVFRYEVPCTDFLQQFTDSITQNFGVIDGNTVNYEARYFQALVHQDRTMTLTQWHCWGRQDFGWYDDQPVESVWDSGWKDLQSPEYAKHPQIVLLRGGGNFHMTLLSEVNSDKIFVQMPGKVETVKELTPHVSDGRTTRFMIESDEEFYIEPYVTIIFDTGGKR